MKERPLRGRQRAAFGLGIHRTVQGSGCPMAGNEGSAVNHPRRCTGQPFNCKERRENLPDSAEWWPTVARALVPLPPHAARRRSLRPQRPQRPANKRFSFAAVAACFGRTL
jgi:hypothetical protein